MRDSRSAQIVRLIMAASAIAACSGAVDGVSHAAPRSVLVSAAASLTDAFQEMGHAFEQANVGIEVELNFGGSSSLRHQILEGAPVDVFASADQSNMDALLQEGLVGESEVFARNRLQIAVPSGNPADVFGLSDFAIDGLLLGLCAPGVPCGDAATEALSRAGVDPSIDTFEPDVRALVTKIAAGELDAAIVYVTDVRSAGGVEAVEIPGEINVVVSYPIAVLEGAADGEASMAFVRFVLSHEGRAILADHGFETP